MLDKLDQHLLSCPSWQRTLSSVLDNVPAGLGTCLHNVGHDSPKTTVWGVRGQPVKDCHERHARKVVGHQDMACHLCRTFVVVVVGGVVVVVVVVVVV